MQTAQNNLNELLWALPHIKEQGHTPLVPQKFLLFTKQYGGYFGCPGPFGRMSPYIDYALQSKYYYSTENSLLESPDTLIVQMGAGLVILRP